MLLIEVHTPTGTLTGPEKQKLGHRMVDGLMVEDDSHALEVLEAERLMFQVLFHEPAAWVLGERRPGDGSTPDPADPPRYLVRVTVPAAWRKDMCAEVVRELTDALAETEEAAGRDPERVRREPHAVILVQGVSEGGIGMFGEAMGSMQLLDQATRTYRRHATPRPVGAGGTPDGRAVDPVCGMTVELGPDTLTLEHDGTRYAFCHGSCRRLYADEHGVPAAS